jgi:Putative Ig domain
MITRALKSAWIAVVCALLSVSLGAQAKQPSVSPQTHAAAEGLTIGTDTALPKTYPYAIYEVRLEARGDSVPPLHWKVESGALPPGIQLEDRGLLHGEPKRAGEYHFTISVTDSSGQQKVKKDFLLTVVEAISLVWRTPAHVTGNRIDGSVEVSNTTADDMDLTFIVLAVAAENSRATAIGYQHFVLRHATVAQRIPFGETLPHGDYVVHVDAVGEVAQRNVIYRQRLAPVPLQVAVGP